MALQMDLNKDRYVSLLEKLIGEVEFLQNSPPKFIPQEDKAIKHLLEALKPYTVENGGVLKVEHVWYVEGRGNLIIEYTPEGATGTVAFVGSHLDVVPANPETWERNPFKLCVEGDKLYGRGTTDCLGHVALITELFIQLAEKKPKLKYSLSTVFIACEENNSIRGVGVDKMMECGKLDHLKNGPIYWMDSADSNPCIGTASAAIWTIKFKGRLFHSGLPHRGINSIELASEAMAYIQRRFYEDFPPHPSEERYHFATPSTMKPTRVTCSEGSINQLPPWTEMRGDLRVTPFYDVNDGIQKVKAYVEELNSDITKLPTRGPCSKYELDLEEGKFCGGLEITFEPDPFKVRGSSCMYLLEYYTQSTILASLTLYFFQLHYVTSSNVLPLSFSVNCSAWLVVPVEDLRESCQTRMEFLDMSMLSCH